MRGPLDREGAPENPYDYSCSMEVGFLSSAASAKRAGSKRTTNLVSEEKTASEKHSTTNKKSNKHMQINNNIKRALTSKLETGGKEKPTLTEAEDALPGSDAQGSPGAPSGCE